MSDKTIAAKDTRNPTFVDLVSSVRMKMLSYKKAGFFSILAMRLNMVENSEIPTCRTDGLTIEFNYEFLKESTTDQRVFALFHEVLHVALLHATRKGTREQERWNKACDYAVNDILHRYGLRIPDGALYDREYETMSAEHIYPKLLVQEQNGNPPPSDGFLGSDLKEPQNNSSSSSGEGDSDGNDEGNNGGNGNNSDDSSDSSNSPNNPQRLSNEQIEQTIKEELINAKTAAEMSSNGIGDMPQELQRFFDELLKPKLPWNLILNRFLNKVDRRAYRFNRPNRRFMPLGIYLPSRTGKGLSRVDFIIDTSGSISKKDFTCFLSEVDAVLKGYKPKEIGVAQFDSEYKGTQIVNKHTDIRTLEFRGGGGTDISDTMEAYTKINTECLIILTDGYIWDLKDVIKPPQPTVWCVYDNENFEAPFGDAIHFSLEDLKEAV